MSRYFKDLVKSDRRRLPGSGTRSRICKPRPQWACSLSDAAQRRSAQVLIWTKREASGYSRLQS